MASSRPDTNIKTTLEELIACTAEWGPRLASLPTTEPNESSENNVLHKKICDKINESIQQYARSLFQTRDRASSAAIGQVLGKMAGLDETWSTMLRRMPTPMATWKEQYIKTIMEAVLAISEKAAVDLLRNGWCGLIPRLEDELRHIASWAKEALENLPGAQGDRPTTTSTTVPNSVAQSETGGSTSEIALEVDPKFLRIEEAQQQRNKSPESPDERRRPRTPPKNSHKRQLVLSPKQNPRQFKRPSHSG